MEQDIITGVRFMGASSMIIIAIILALVNRGRVQSKVYNRSRWFAFTGCILMGIHTLMQFFGHFREISPTMAWIVNLMFYAPAIPAFNLAELNLLRAGHNLKMPIIRACIFITLCFIIFGVGVATDTIINDTEPYKTVTFAIACLLFWKIIEMSYVLKKDMRIVKLSLNEDELRERHKVLRFTATSMNFTLWFSYLTPWVGISGSLALHSIFAISMFGMLIWYLTTFFLYGRNMTEVIEVSDEIYVAAVSDKETHPDVSEAIVESIQKWVGERHFTDPNITLSMALEQMKIPANALNLYLEHYANINSYRKWIPYLRIEEAKRLIRENPMYSYDTIAEKSGFSTGGSMARAFKAQTGMTPIQWLDNSA